MTRKYLTQDEVYRLMDAAQSMSFPERNRCLIMMAFIHGFRASELLDLRLSDIDASGKQLNIRRIKNGFSTTHPLLPDEYNLIKLWLNGFAPIFPDICYHLPHYKPAAADIPVASDNPAHYADAIRYNARTPLQGSLLPLTRLVWA